MVLELELEKEMEWWGEVGVFFEVEGDRFFSFCPSVVGRF